MTGSRFATILFDFDYTLADSSAGCIECVRHALVALDLPAAGDDAIRSTIGLSLPDMLVVLAGRAHASRAAEFARLFIERADEVMVERTELLPGAAAAVAELARRGVRLGIVSTKYRRRIESVLTRDGIADLFAVVVGGEDVAAHKPDPEGLLAAVARLDGARARTTLYVGDSTTDATTAARAAVPFAAVLTGTTAAAAFDPFPCLGRFEGLESLVGWLTDGAVTGDEPSEPSPDAFQRAGHVQR